MKDYGLVIMDECHHGASQTAEEVLKHFEAKPAKGEIVVVVGGKSLK